jgi:hypothetical protein
MSSTGATYNSPAVEICDMEPGSKGMMMHAKTTSLFYLEPVPEFSLRFNPEFEPKVACDAKE